MRFRPIEAAALAAALSVSLVGCAPSRVAEPSAQSVAVYRRDAEIKDPAKALALLKDGHARYVSGAPLAKDISQARRSELAKGQKPFAVILTCSDSRVPPEVVFDQALGDLFVVRTAGNVVDPVVLGSIEYAVEHLGAPLVVVMGHTSCGAVKATVEGGEAPGSIGAITKLIAPAVEQAKAEGTRDSAFAEKSADNNVELQLAAVGGSKILEEKVKSQQLEIVGAKYDIESGMVGWF